MMGYGAFGFIWTILFWGFLIFLIVWVLTQIKGRSCYNKDTKNNKETPLDILKLRFTKGELTKKQYEDMKKELKR